MAGTKNLTYKIGADLGALRRAMEEGEGATAKQRKELRLLERQQTANRQALNSLGIGMLSFGAAAVLGLGMAVREAIRWESAFAGVRKTVDGSDEEIAALEGELRGLAKTLPATHQEIAAVAEAAGQLGIKRQDIAQFTETMIALGETTNLTADQAATALAQFMNIMGTSAGDVDRLGSALVALGNAGASTEQDIISMGLRIAGAGHQVGLSENEVLSFASALSSVGIEAEAGGSAFSRVMIDMSSAVNDGGQKLADFAEIAGMSGARFQKTFKEDASKAIIAFIQGLGKMQAEGGNVLGVMERLDFTEIRVRDALLRAAGASDMFTSSLKVGSEGWAENQALAAEAAKRYATTEAQMQTAGNAIKDALIDIGAALLPILQGGVEIIRDLITWFQNLPGPIKTAVAVLGAVTAAVTVLGGAALIAVPKILVFRESMTSLAASGGKMTSALGKFGLFMSGPWGVAIGLGITLLGAFAASSGAAQQQQKGFADAGKAVAEAIAEQNGVINESVRQSAAKEAADRGLYNVGRALGVSVADVTDAVLKQGDAYGRVKDRLMDLAENGTEGQRVLAQQMLTSIDAMIAGTEGQLQAEEDVAAAAGMTTDELREQSGANKGLAATAEEAADALNTMLESLDKLNGVTLSHREAQRDLVKTIGEANTVFADNSKTLDINTADGMENAETLDSIAESMNGAAEAAAREAESVGGAAAGNSALVASLQASRQSLFDTARQFFDSEEATWAYVDSVLAIPPEASTDVLTPGAVQAQTELMLVRDAVIGIPPNKAVNVGVISAQAIAALETIGYKVNRLPDGSVTVVAQTSQAKKDLDNLVNANKNRVFTWTVKVQRRQSDMDLYGMTSAYGNIVQFADGGVHRESHQPQIAQAVPGTVRMWAEPETYRESYIPWAPDRRGRATEILRTTADAFGYALMPKSRMVQSYAHGGMYGGGAGSMADALAGCSVNLYIGNEQFRGYIRAEISGSDRQTGRAVRAGSGNNR